MPQTSSSQPWSLAGKTAIVTGGTRGIGKAIALYLAQKGLSRLAITYANSADAADATAEACRRVASGNNSTITVVTAKADLLDPEVGAHLVADVQAKLRVQTIDILVNNAVPTDLSLLQPITALTADVFAKGMQGIVFGPVSITSAVLPLLPAGGGGRVIFVSSIASRVANPDPLVIYGAGKAAMDSVNRSMATLLAADKGATFNTVSVGPTLTETYDQLVPQEEARAAIAKGNTAATRLGQPEDVAFIVGFLASEEARWVNGASVSANGGLKEILAAQG